MSNEKLENFKGYSFKIEYEDIVDKYAKECVAYLKQSSPRNRYTMARARGKYADGWTLNQSKAKQNYQSIVWNETNWQFTHLLENGHLIVNKRGGVGWASPHPHIAPAMEKVKAPFERAMAKANIRSN